VSLSWSFSKDKELEIAPIGGNYPPIPDFDLFHEGYRDLKWGDSPSILGERHIIEEYVVSSEKTYEKTGKTFEKVSDDLYLGEAKLKAIQYKYNKDRLYAIIFIAKNEEEYVILRQYAHKIFEKNIKWNDYIWIGGGIALSPNESATLYGDSLSLEISHRVISD
jgi:hypothetical protein